MPVTNDKPKFDKKKCLKCKYHGVGNSGYITRKGNQIIHVNCDYAIIMRTSCLKPNGVHGVIDTRGDDYHNCKLFEEGKRVEKDKVQIAY